MKIEYVWHEEPDRVKVFDTVRDKRSLRILTDCMTQQEYDERQLRLIEQKKQSGLILSYKIISEEE